jgi:tetratricopeptide (TPR) repeat protein
LCAKCLFALGLAQGQKQGDESDTPHGRDLNLGEQGESGTSPASIIQAPSIAAGLPTEKPGDWIGRYKLLQEIGQGGCGVVYLAEQEQPVRRRVALKVIKLGMDTRQVIARFEAERQALALMDHPNIAKVLDGGTTETGRPYFVMELVRGTKLTDYCDANNLATAERLKLFVQVCQAIQHAHQKGIIHRDIKPSNILVTVNDRLPVPKVIDFGIAKATAGPLTDKTLLTAFEQFIGTPAYMSPEQAEMSGLDIDTRSDIYSLGVLLYELLTGKTPFDPKEMASAGLEGVRHLIREKDPVRPSTRLGMLSAAEQATIAERRQLDASKLVHLLRGDLDWIVMKCLEKDRARRYETANGLARDIERHLNNEPVAARPPGKLYRFQKLARRNKVVFAAGGAVVMALVAGLALATWQFIEKSKALQGTLAAEKRAKTAANGSRRMTSFLSDLLREVVPSAAAGQDTPVLHKILHETASKVTEDFGDQPELEAELRTTLGFVYEEIGDSRQAESMFRRALALRRNLFGEEHPAVAAALSHLSPPLWDQRKLAEAQANERRALELRQQSLGPNSPEAAESLYNLGHILWIENKLAEAEAMLRCALEVRQKAFGEEHVAVADSLNTLAAVLSSQGKWADAEAKWDRALAIERKLLGQEHPKVAEALDKLAGAYLAQGQLPAAEAAATEALAIRTKRFGNDNPHVASEFTTLGRVLLAEGKRPEAEARLRQALAVWSRQSAKDEPGRPAAVRALADIFLAERRYSEAEELVGGLPKDIECLRVRGEVLARLGHWREAAANFQQVVELDPNGHDAYHALAPLLIQSGDVAGYRALCKEIRGRFSGCTNDPAIADRMAKDCLILPAPGTDLAIEVRWAEAAVALGKGYGGEVWFQFCKGLAEYRQGRFAAAAERMDGILNDPDKRPRREVASYMIKAMAREQLNQPFQARAAFASGIELAHAEMPSLEGGDVGAGWIDWLIACALMREARTLVEDGTSEPANNREKP